MPEGFQLIKGNRKDSPKVEAVPIWLRRAAQGSFTALLQLTVRKRERWEMRSLGVIKAPRLALLPGRGWLLSSGQRAPVQVMAQGAGAERLGALPAHGARVGAHPAPRHSPGSSPLHRTHNACSWCRGGHVQAVLTPGAEHPCSELERCSNHPHPLPRHLPLTRRGGP